MANSGCQEDAAATEAHFVDCFKDFDTVVGPSGSCVHHVRVHLDAINETPPVRKVRTATKELVEFLHDDLKVNDFPWAAFPHKVGLHDSCSAVRGLGHTRPSELVYEPYFSKTRDLLAKVRGLELAEIEAGRKLRIWRQLLCYGWAVSAKWAMTGSVFYRHGTSPRFCRHVPPAPHEIVIDRLKLPMKVIHIAQVLNGAR